MSGITDSLLEELVEANKAQTAAILNMAAKAGGDTGEKIAELSDDKIDLVL